MEDEQVPAMEDEQVPVETPPKGGLPENWLKLVNRVLLTLVSLLLLSLIWQILRFFPPSLDLATLLVAGGIFAIVLIVGIPKLQIFRLKFKSNVERFGVENEARKTVATLVGGLAIFMSFYTAQQQLGVQQQVQFTDRYTKAIDQIAASDANGNPRLAVRIGGLYVLEQIMDSSEAQHASILEVLCAYIRDNSLQKMLKPSNEPRADTRVALTILGRRNRDLEVSAERKRGWRLVKAVMFDHEFLNAFTVQHVQPHLDLSGSDLEHADMSHLVLAGANLSGTRLTNCRALFSDLNHVNFNNADLSGCIIASTLEGANFNGAHLEGAVISGKVTGVTFQGADVTLSIWNGANLEHPRDLQAAKGWEKAFYNARDLEILGLPPDHNVKLLRLIRSRMPVASIEVKMLFTTVLQQLQTLTEKAQDIRDELLNPSSH